MTTLRIPDLHVAVAGVGLDLTAFGSTTRLTVADLDRLGEGESVKVSDATAKRVAEVLGVKLGAITSAKGGPDLVPDGYDDGAAEVFDASPVARADGGWERSGPTREQIEDTDPTPPFERALREAEGFTSDHRAFVQEVFASATLPSSVTARELPAIAKGLLGAARDQLAAGDRDPMALLQAVVDEGPRACAKMAQQVIDLHAQRARMEVWRQEFLAKRKAQGFAEVPE